MRTLVSFPILFLATLLNTSHIVHAGTGDGGVVGSGGSVVCDENGANCISADLYFEQNKWELPSYYLGKVDLSKDKLLMKELTAALRITCIRYYGVGCPGSYVKDLLSAFEFYSVKRFSGGDAVHIEGVETRQAAYTFTVNTPVPDFSGAWITRKLVELDMSILSGMEPRQRALVVFHELTHHLLAAHDPDHQVISPLIKALHTLMGVRLRQLSGDWSPINDVELLASKQFQNLLVEHFNPNPKLNVPQTSPIGRYDGFTTAAEIHQIDPEDGGVIFIPNKQYALPWFSKVASGHVGVSATVAPLSMPEYTELKDNVYFDSGIRISANEEGSCVRNSFVRVFGGIRCLGSANKLIDVVSVSEGNWLFRDAQENPVTSDLEILGDENLIRNVHFASGVIPIGGGNVIEDSIIRAEQTYKMLVSDPNYGPYRWGISRTSDGEVFYGGTKGAINGAVIKNSTVGPVANRAPIKLVNVNVPKGVNLWFDASHPIALENLNVVYDQRTIRFGTQGLTLRFKNGDQQYSFSANKNYDLTKTWLEEKVTVNGRGFIEGIFASVDTDGYGVDIPVIKINEFEELAELFTAVPGASDGRR